MPFAKKPLKNIRHEIVAKAISEGKNKGEAYKIAYPNANATSTLACQLIKAHPEVAQRAIDLVKSRRGTALPALLQKLEEKLACQRPYGKNNMMADDNANQLEAVKVLLKLHGELKDGPLIDQSSQTINITPDLVRDLGSVVAKLKAINDQHNDIVYEAFEQAPVNSPIQSTSHDKTSQVNRPDGKTNE